MTAPLDVAVIGGGQSGLAVGYHLARRGLRYAIFDASPSAGHVWRNRWDGLRLITPCPYNSLPGTPFPAADWSFPTKDEVADYLDDYERRHRLAIHHDTLIDAVRKADEGTFSLHGAPAALSSSSSSSPSSSSPGSPSAGELARARAIVVATGAFRRPHTPAFAAAGAMPQLHSLEYRRPAQVPAGEVLVVGCGNSGAGIACELAASHRVTLSLGLTGSSPRTMLGRDLFWWAHHVGLTRLPARSWLARRMQAGPDGLIGPGPEALAALHGFTLAPRTEGLDGDHARFADGSRRRFDAVVWATGFRPDHPALAELADSSALFDDRGRPRHRDGLSPLPGLCFLGLPWQRRIDSSLLGGVGGDAAHLAQHLTRHLAATPSPRVFAAAAAPAFPSETP